MCDAFARTGVAGDPDEYFADEPRGALHAPTWLGQRLRLTAREYCDYLLAAHSGPNGVFGGKITAAQMTELTDGLRSEFDPGLSRASLLGMVFPELRYIWITRRNKTEQAVSFWRALQSGSYNSRQRSRSPSPRFSFSIIDHTVDQLVFYERLWGDFFAREGVVPLTIAYEDFVLNYETTIRSALAYLGIDAGASLEPPPPQLERQADALSRAWVRKYESMKRRHRQLKIVLGLRHILGSEERRRVYWARFAREPRLEGE